LTFHYNLGLQAKALARVDYRITSSLAKEEIEKAEKRRRFDRLSLESLSYAVFQQLFCLSPHLFKRIFNLLSTETMLPVSSVVPVWQTSPYLIVTLQFDWGSQSYVQSL